MIINSTTKFNMYKGYKTTVPSLPVVPITY